MMPAFSAFAGFSPSCDAVFVQIEHCADTFCATAIASKIHVKTITILFFIRMFSGAKIQIDSKGKFFTFLS